MRRRRSYAKVPFCGIVRTAVTRLNIESMMDILISDVRRMQKCRQKIEIIYAMPF